MTQKIIDFNLDIKNKSVSLSFERGETASLYLFGKDVYTVVSDGITKSVLREVKSDCLYLFSGKLSEDEFKSKWVFKT